jgi:maltose O-acetyltransferase
MPIGKDDFVPVIIEDDVWIGGHAVVLKGVTVGHGSVVALGSIVIKYVLPMTVTAGNPAQVATQIVPFGGDPK